MDDPVPNPYVRSAMNLLMLLSALLSALSVGGVAVRRPEVAQAVAQVVAARDVAAEATAAATRRPVLSLPKLSAVVGEGSAVALSLPPIAAPWTTRRRE